MNKDAVCRGSWGLGNNCKECQKCLETAPAEIERLRKVMTAYEESNGHVLESWQNITAERNRVKEMLAAIKETLKPFADYGRLLPTERWQHDFETVLMECYGTLPNVTVGDCRRAAEVLTQLEGLK